MRKLFELAVKIAGFWFVLALISFVPVNVSKTEAGGLVVTTTADSGDGSFRDALTTAINSPGGDTITFDPSVFPPNSPATINATAVYEVEAPAASDPLTISALGAGVIFDFTGVTEGDAAFHFKPDGPIESLILKNFTIQNFTSDTNHEGHGIEIGFAPTSVSNLNIENMTITGMSADGLFLNADENFSGIIEGNTISDNDGNGIHITAGTTSGLFIQSNDITDNGSKGIDLDVIDPNVASTAFINQNTISGHSNDGIFIGGPETTTAIHATISQNSTFDNDGIGINLLGFGNEFGGVTDNDIGDTDQGANDLLNFPEINGFDSTGFFGEACANCLVEIFLSDSDPTDHGEGKTYLESGTADAGGNFAITACVAANSFVTATATDSFGNTSEFSLNFSVPFATCDASFIQGDLDCDQDVDGRDSLLAFVYRAELNGLSQEPDCPLVGQSTQPVGSAGTQGLDDRFGDVNCSGDVETNDALNILQYLAHVDLNPNPPIDCTPIGSTIGTT